MLNANDQVYYARRSEHAMVLGNQATDPKIAAIHFELALRYAIASVRSPRAQPDLPATNDEGRARRPEPARSAPYVSLDPDCEYALR